MKRYDRWTEADRDQLRELAKVNTSDHAIADLMRRLRSSVSWQRRKLRIKLKPAPIARRREAKEENSVKRYDRWTEADRDQLRELAKVNTSDHAIADLMRRLRSSVSWQRRKLRIKLKPAPISRRKQAEKEYVLQPPPPCNRIERMMELAEMCAL